MSKKRKGKPHTSTPRPQGAKPTVQSVPEAVVSEVTEPVVTMPEAVQPVAVPEVVAPEETPVAAVPEVTPEPAVTEEPAPSRSPIRELLKEHSFYAPRASEETDWEEDEEAEEEEYNRASVNRLKKAILVALLLMFLIPTVICLILLTKMHSMEKEIEQLREDIKSKAERQVLAEQQASKTTLEADVEAQLERDKKGDVNVLHQAGGSAKAATADTEADTEETTETDEIDPATVPEEKRVYLTFDDGPSDDVDAILDVLKEKNVKATFFMVIDDKSKQAAIRRMAAEGHTLGIHSVSHVYSEIYADLDSFKQDVETVHDLLYDMTGQDVKLYRFPGGSSNRVSDVPVEDCIEYLEEAGYTYFDWNASNGDSSGSGYTAEQLEDNVLRYVHNNSGATVVLMHDFTGCPATAESLPHLIDTLREEGYVLLPIDENTTPVHHRKTAKEKAAEAEAEQAALEKARRERAELEGAGSDPEETED